MSWQTRLAEATSLPLLEVHGQEIVELDVSVQEYIAESILC